MSFDPTADADLAAGMRPRRKHSTALTVVVLVASVLGGVLGTRYAISRWLPHALEPRPASAGPSLPEYAVPAPPVPADRLERALDSMRAEQSATPATHPTTNP